MAKCRAHGEGSVYRRKDGRWEAKYTDLRELDPKKRRKTIPPDKSQRVVVDKLNAAIAEMRVGDSLLTKDNPTVTEWLSIWLKEYKILELSDGTYESYDRNIKVHLTPLIGHLRLKELTGLHIQQMYNNLEAPKSSGGRGLSRASVIKIKNILSGALQQSVINKIIRSNPILETKPPKVNDSDIRILTKAEQKQFISVLPFFNTGNLFAISLATGVRIGELCALNPDADINREQKYISITKSAGRRKDKYTGEVSIKIGPPKTKYSVRKIPLLPSVEVMIDRQLKLVNEWRQKAGASWNENNLLFPTEEGNLRNLSGLRTAMGRILERAGLEHMSIHALRHTYATTALNAGVAAQNVARLLGHKDGATTLKFYAHYIDTEAIAQLEKLEQQNISHLGITTGELEHVVQSTANALQRNSIADIINSTILNAKNAPPKKSIEQVISVCEDILCQPIDALSIADKDILLTTLSQFIVMKRQLTAQGKTRKKTQQTRSR